MAKRGFHGAVMRTFGARDHVATVIGGERLAPHFIRIRMISPTLFEDVITGPAAYLRFWFPDVDGRPGEHQRGYTLTEADSVAGTFAVDFVLHEPEGPASAWARRAEPGTTVPVTSLGSAPFEVPAELPAGYLLIGDAASIPALNGIVEALPDEVPIERYLEQHDHADRLIPLADHPRITTHWVLRRGPESLAASLEDRDWSDWYVWVTPEAGSLKHLRAVLRDRFGFPRAEMHPQAYWSQGRAMGKARTPEEAAGTTSVTPSEATEDTPEGSQLSEQELRADVQQQTAASSQPGPSASPTAGRWRSRAGGCSRP